MRIFIEPTEPLLFRTGRPFTAGENTFAESIFPPTPETLQGALRATIAIHWGQKQTPPLSGAGNLFQQKALIELIGIRTDRGDTYGRFRITGVTLGRRNPDTLKIERLFPTPAHIIRVTLKNEAGRKSQQPVLLQPEEQTPGTTDLSADYALLVPSLQGKTVERAKGRSARRSSTR
jgi:CRISPR-associated protein Cmr3